MGINEKIIDQIFDKEINIKNLIDEYNLLFAIADNQYHFLKLNINWEDVLGYTIDELTKKAFTDFTHPEDLNKTLTAYEEGEIFNKKAEPLIGFTNRYRTKDGRYAVIDWLNVIKTNSKEIVAIAIFKNYE